VPPGRDPQAQRPGRQGSGHLLAVFATVAAPTWGTGTRQDDVREVAVTATGCAAERGRNFDVPAVTERGLLVLLGFFKWHVL